MDNYIFRTAIGGFNRQDVTDYIEKVQKQAAEAAAAQEREAAELRASLERAGAERDEALASLEARTGELDEARQQLESMSLDCATAKHNWDAQVMANAAIREDVARRDKTIAELQAERDLLTERVAELETWMENLRREKERVTQLELDAHGRSDSIIAQAQKQAKETVIQAEAQAAATVSEANAQAKAAVDAANTQAKATVEDARAQAETIVAQAQEKASGLLQETEDRISATLEQYNELRGSFETITGHITGELRKLDVTASQLPISLDHLQKGLTDLAKRAKER